MSIKSKIKAYFENKIYDNEGIPTELINAVKTYFVSLEGAMTSKQAVQFIKEHPELLNFDANGLKARFNEFAKCGWSKTQITKAYSRNKNIMSINLNDLKDKVMIYKEIGYSSNYIIENPMLLSCPSKDIKLKYMYAKTLGFRDYVNISYFVQSFQKTYARAHYLQNMHESVAYNLLLSEYQFFKKFNTSESKLKSKYVLNEKAVQEIQDEYNKLAKTKGFKALELSEEEQAACVKRNNIRDLKSLFRSMKHEDKEM